MSKAFEKLVTNCLCCVPCYPAKYAFVIFFYDILLSRWSCYSLIACNSYFFCSKNRVKNFNPCVLFQSNKPVFFCFHRRNLRGEWNKFIEGVCFMQFQVGRFEIPPDHVHLLFATFLVNLKFTSKLNRCILKTIYIEHIASLWSEDSLVVSACWLVLEQILTGPLILCDEKSEIMRPFRAHYAVNYAIF